MRGSTLAVRWTAPQASLDDEFLHEPQHLLHCLLGGNDRVVELDRGSNQIPTTEDVVKGVPIWSRDPTSHEGWHDALQVPSVRRAL